MKKLILIICLIATNCFYSQNQHEPQNWFKLYSTYVNVIYKAGQEKEAQDIANTISYIQKNNSKSIGFHYQPIDIVLRSNTVESNGFVTVSPFRSEFFNTAPTTFNSLGTTNWISTLAIHEYRHVQQFLNHKSGVTKILYYLFGESGWGLGSVLSIPDWYFEGDAVVMETALTQSGRGRLPKFTALQRALYRDHILYNYSKTRNGSFKDLVPNHYLNGYQMLNYYRNHFNPSRINNITNKAAAYQFPFYPFSYQLKKETGLTTKGLYKKAAEANKQQWATQRESLDALKYQAITQTNSKVAVYNFPQKMENGNIITLKTQLNEIPTFYEIDLNGEEHKLTPNIINQDNYFHYQNNQILFTGFSYHPRYNYTNYSDVLVHDLKTGKRRKITSKKRYFSPFFNADNSLIVAVEANEGKYHLVILDKKGNELDNLPTTGVISRPKFINNETLVYLKQENHRLAIFSNNVHTLKETQLTQWTSHTLDNLFVENDMVYFSASFNGIDNIYRTDLQGTKKLEQVTNSSIGAYQPSVSNNTLYFTETTSNGTQVSSTNIAPVKVRFKEPILMDWNNDKTVAFEGGNILDSIPKQQFSTKRYTSLLEDLKFHDWLYTLSDQEVTANVTATTLLNDFSLNAGTNVYLNEQNSFGFNLMASYQKWFPMLNIALEYQHREFKGTAFNSLENSIINGIHQFQTLQLVPSVTIPYSQVNGNYNNNIALNLGYELESRFAHNFTVDETNQNIEIDGLTSNYLRLQLQASSVRRKAVQNINARAGVSTLLSFNKGFNNRSYLNGNYISSFNRLFLPGFFKDHNSYASFGYLKNEIQQTDSFRYARGFETSNAVEASNLSLNYQLPLFYPDLGVLGITYFKRIRANLFADFSNVSYSAVNVDRPNELITVKTQQNSAGFEIIFDNTYFNIRQALIGIGYRGSFLLTNDYQRPGNKFVSRIFISTTLF
ncbi:hypothetical protein [Wenyingzhuangia sp. IMCC45574]